MLHDTLEPAIFLYQFQPWFWTNTSDGFQVIASQQNTKVNELQITSQQKNRLTKRCITRTWLIFISRPSRAASRLISLMGCFLASEKVRWRNSIGELNVRVSISSEPAAYTSSKVNTENNNIGRNEIPFLHVQVLHTVPPLQMVPALDQLKDIQASRYFTHDDDGNTHKFKETPTLLVMFTRNFHGSTWKPVQIFYCTRLFGLFTLLLCFLSPFETFW